MIIVKTLIIILISFLSFNSAYSDWESEQVVSANAAITEVHFYNDFIFAIGNDNIYRYSTENQDWETLVYENIEIQRFENIYSYSDSIFISFDNGIIYSADSGTTWKKYLNYSNMDRLNTFTQNDEYLFAGWTSGVYKASKSDYDFAEIEIPNLIQSDFITSSGNNLAIAEQRSSNGIGGGLFLSSDNGESWESYFSGEKVIDVTVKSDTVITIVDDEVFTSFDYGNSWISFSIGKAFFKVNYHDSYIYLLSSIGDFSRYNLETEQIEVITNVLENPDIFCYNLKGNDDNIYVTSTNGIYKYSIIDEEIDINSPKKKSALFFTISKNNNELLATSYTAGTYSKQQDSEEWDIFDEELNTLSESILRVHYLNGRPYFLDYKRTKFYYQNTENEWIELPLSPNSKAIGFGVGIIDDIFYYNDNQAIYFTSDNGQTWGNIQGPLDDMSGNNWWVNSMSIFNGEIYGGTRDGIYKYSIDDESWSKMTITDPDVAANGEVVRFYQDDESVFAIIDRNGYNLFELDQNDNYWNKRFEFDSSNVRNLAWVENTFFWKSGDKLFMKNNDGQDELIISNNLDNFDVNFTYDLNIIDEYIFVAGNDGIYKRLLSDLGISSAELNTETENYVYTMKPYPLPASDRVTVDIYLSESPETIQTSVYNSEGVKIDNGENIEITGGRWPGQLTWECGTQSPGVYYIQIISGSKKHAIPVVVGE